MFQIALKNYLALWSKQLMAKAFYELAEEKFGAHAFSDMKQELAMIDMQDYERFINDAMKQGRPGMRYRLDLYIPLPYVVPIAFQGAITVISGFMGSLINNTFNKALHSAVQDLHICVFPFEETSVVLCFTNRKHNRYRSFFRTLRSLNRDEQLSVIQYLILAYDGSVAFSDSLDASFFKDEAVLDVVGKEATVFSTESHSATELGEYAAECYSCEAAFDLPNLLSTEFAI